MAIVYKSYLAIEKRPSFMGIALTDILILVGLFVLMLFGGAVLMVIGIFTPYWFAFSLLFFIVSIIFLKTRSSKGQPAFFISYYSFIYMQPRKLKPLCGKLKLQK